MTPTQKLKATILNNWINSLENEPMVANLLRRRIERYVKDSPDEIREYEQTKELDRIKYGDR